jgi:hypothetical protein
VRPICILVLAVSCAAPPPPAPPAPAPAPDAAPPPAGVAFGPCVAREVVVDAGALGMSGLDVVEPVDAQLVVGTGLGASAVARGVRGAGEELHACWDARQGARKRSTHVVLHAEIAADGAVARSATEGDPALAGCVDRVVRELRFPPPRGGAAVALDGPLRFAAAPTPTGPKRVPLDEGAARALFEGRASGDLGMLGGAATRCALAPPPDALAAAPIRDALDACVAAARARGPLADATLWVTLGPPERPARPSAHVRRWVPTRAVEDAADAALADCALAAIASAPSIGATCAVHVVPDADASAAARAERASGADGTPAWAARWCDEIVPP